MKSAIGLLRYFLSYLILSVATLLMLQMVVDYSSFDDKIHFLAFKQDYIHLPLWKAAFYTHVFSSVLALAAGFTQFNPNVLKDHRRIHRWIGRIYAYDILIVNFPAGMILAIYANGLLPSKIAFVILDGLWFLFTLKAVQAAREGRFKQHREFMIRSYALTFSAITLRTWKIVLSHTLHPDPLHLYMMDAWMGFVPNLLFAEWLIRWRPWLNRPLSLKSKSGGNDHYQQITDDQETHDKRQPIRRQRTLPSGSPPMSANGPRNKMG